LFGILLLLCFVSLLSLTFLSIFSGRFRDDGIPRQYNFVIDEAETMDFDGKGIRDPNSVISMIDYTLTQFSHSEKKTLHAGN
jgi:hypothetical protein